MPASNPLFMIPGTMCDERLWRDLWPHLQGCEPNHLPIPEGSKVDELVHALLAALPLEPVNLFGFSLGGYLAAALATAHPDRIRRLFICANTPCALPDAEINQRRQLLKWVERHGYGGISERKIAAMLAPENRLMHDIADCMRAMDATLGERTLVAQLTATSIRDDLAQPLGKLEFPVTFCFGQADTLVNRDWLRALQRGNPAIQVQELSGAGHMLPLEAPRALARAIHAWLD